ncbi:hypothetical protein SGRA_0435 [Saprospira grandis str. Lewin]|uniref:Uncharacterized protein n=1 Tax=Saprospira grandis (strain Lewin) TaxID=984262 RepID=H6L938_SAPGL|nr:hypothetical protein SGRA_0435 [Saprospira grandis str. Lewin]
MAGQFCADGLKLNGKLQVGKANKDFLRQFAQVSKGLLKKDSCPKNAKIKF